MILNSFKVSCNQFQHVVDSLDSDYRDLLINHEEIKKNLSPLLNNDEEFRYIVGFPNYVVTNYGRVFNILTFKELKQARFCTGSKKRANTVANNTYKRNKVTLCANGIAKCFYVHQLVGKYFLPEPIGIDNPVIDHIDHDTSNNHYTNLRWRSLSDNSSDTTNAKYTSMSLEELIELRKKCKYRSNEYNVLNTTIKNRRRKIKHGTQGN